MDFRDSGGAGLQPHKRFVVDSSCPPVGAGGVPVLVRPEEPGDDLVGSELLLPLQQRGFDNEGERQVGEVVLHFPVSAREQQVRTLQKHTALLPLNQVI